MMKRNKAAPMREMSMKYEMENEALSEAEDLCLSLDEAED